jgi:hypothetical protein
MMLPEPAMAGEHALLRRFLDQERLAVLHSLAGVPAGLLREPLVVPDGSLLAIVRHLTHLERWWFTYTFAGVDSVFPEGAVGPGGDWRLDPRQTTTEIVRSYRAECARSRRQVERASPDQVAARPAAPGHVVTLRWIYLHVIVETSRHNGHANFMRSLIDGADGPPPCASDRFPTPGGGPLR